MSSHYYTSGYDANGYDANGYDDRGYKAGQDGPSYQIFNSRRSQTMVYTSSRDGAGYVVDMRTPGAEATEFRGRRQDPDGYPEISRQRRSRSRHRTTKSDKRYKTEYRSNSLPRYRSSSRGGGRSPHAYRPKSPARTHEGKPSYRPRSRSAGRERRRSRERRHTTDRSPRHKGNSRRHRTTRTNEPERSYGGNSRRYEPERDFAGGEDSGRGTTIRQYVDENGEVVAKVQEYEPGDDGTYPSHYSGGGYRY